MKEQRKELRRRAKRILKLNKNHQVSLSESVRIALEWILGVKLDKYLIGLYSELLYELEKKEVEIWLRGN